MRRAGRDGFTLIEALVAFAIVAGATMVVQRSLVQSRVATAQVADRMAPDWLVRSLLAEPLSDLDMNTGGRSGVEGGRRFEVRLTPLVDIDEDLAIQPADRTPSRADRQVRWQPMRVSISVEKNQAQWLTVQTVKLGRVRMTKPGLDGE
ncbi:prepilin-type N-terminal cleavage/methylation domain-containing protein [Methylobacterium sp. J-076]|uniref:prepilin-type N-terminal cleavage/methylation domain-containing protein n=1 Tax=Methylobacterium sp. J-076 TaxID=2836655 RepID=UPI001FBB13AE|nr:prepilin-type N-terminal cleavage/methylation domain-containing protein [Methylobacterium sp. J-076]MCJ2011901.1 prepilin-type N-terminal cleavage/methylation domain-containing protein [Methylobacterium sp. J-076]